MLTVADSGTGLFPTKRPLLLGSGSPNVAKVMIMLEEVERSCHVAWLDVMGGALRKDSFLALNRNAKVPVYLDVVDGQELIITESGAILQHLAEQSEMLLRTTGPQRSAVLSWLMFQMASVGPIFGQYLHFRFVARNEPYALHRFSSEMARIVNVLEVQLAQDRYIAGAEYSIADIAIFPWVRTVLSLSTEILEKPCLARWYADIAERPAVVRALRVVDKFAERDRDRMARASKAERDRYFNRPPVTDNAGSTATDGRV